MKIWISLITTFFCVLSAVSQGQTTAIMILDTDIDSDVDDVGALAMLHTLADHEVVDILGVVDIPDHIDPYASV